ncbi:MAG: caspase family protein [Bacteroidales bacterium]|nr:MAG: caspase family protein [Bacteroidales bacterium]
MTKITIILLLAFLSISGFSQTEEFVYKNTEFGIEVKFPSKPTENTLNNTYVNQKTATLNLVSAGLSYGLLIQKSIVKIDMLKTFKDAGDVTIMSNYTAGDNEVTEFKMLAGGACTRYKIINIKKILILLSVTSQSCAQDKDVLPFYNSLKINDIIAQNPNIDNSKFKTFAIDYPSNARTDTVTKVVYVNSGSKTSYQYEKLSDVDKNIPQNASTNPYHFALIVGNEDYSSHQLDLKSESNVDFARNDASAFKEYCSNTLGIPEKNITFLLDATVGQINQGIAKLKLLSKASNGKSQLIVFYAGHGLPDENTKEPYLIPVDVNGANVTSGIKLQDLYSNLTEYPSERITVYLDACFTGGGRNAGLLAGRGVKVKPKEGVLKGNIIVFSSSSGEQSSLPFNYAKHGMFTYYLLKKLQETKGDLTYSELSDFLSEKISIESLLVNSKEQNPVVNTSPNASEKWKSWRLK